MRPMLNEKLYSVENRPKWISKFANVNSEIDLREPFDIAPLTIPINEITVITGGSGKKLLLDSLGIAHTERVRAVDETGWWLIDEESSFSWPMFSTQYIIPLNRKSYGARFNTRFSASTDTTILAFEDEHSSPWVLDSTGESVGKIGVLNRIFKNRIPLFCIHSWRVNDAQARSMSTYYFSVLLQYDLDEGLYSAALASIESGSRLPLGVNLADEEWIGHLLGGYIGYFFRGNNLEREEIFPISASSLPLLSKVPRGIDPLVLRLLGIKFLK